MKSKDELIDDLLTLAFAEDVGDGDHTTLSTIPANAMGKQRLIIKEPGGIYRGQKIKLYLFSINTPIKIHNEMFNAAISHIMKYM